MDTKRFNELVDEVLSECRKTLVIKAGEYATDDRLHNFKVAGRLNDCSGSEALWGMVTKHIVSLKDITRSDQSFKRAFLQEKIGDVINYCILLFALKEDEGKVIDYTTCSSLGRVCTPLEPTSGLSHKEHFYTSSAA